MTEVKSNLTLESTPLTQNKMSLENFKVGISNIIYQVAIAKDGNLWCALIGQDMQNGIAGFGHTVQEALQDLAAKV